MKDSELLTPASTRLSGSIRSTSLYFSLLAGNLAETGSHVTLWQIRQFTGSLVTPWLDGKRAARKPTETRNLLAENDLYQTFEFTFLRQLVWIVREVTSKAPILSNLAAYFAILRPRPVAEKSTSYLLNHKYSEIL